eukprot:COSAG01_NODE_57224_length_313_cov_1.439252_1_plen_49_part_01
MRTQLPVTLVVGLPVAAIMYVIVNHATSYVPGAFIDPDSTQIVHRYYTD